MAVNLYSFLVLINFLKMKLNHENEKLTKQSNMFDNTWLIGGEVCQILRISTRTLANYKAKGILPFAQVGRKIYYKFRDVEELLDRHYFKPLSWKGGF
jgi:hypothetical protein